MNKIVNYSYCPKEDKFSEGYFECKKSKFYSYVYNVNNEDEIKEILDYVKKENKGAKHLVYAYILKNTSKYTDDGEPSGTAGKAIYNILIKEHIVGNLVVVVRYFGGTLLGTGTLSRSYIKSFKDATYKCEKKEYINNCNT